MSFSFDFFCTMQLSGDSGKAILGTIANITTNQTNSTNETDGGLWRWGKVPVGHLVNTSGNLVMVLPPQTRTRHYGKRLDRLKTIILPKNDC